MENLKISHKILFSSILIFILLLGCKAEKPSSSQQPSSTNTNKWELVFEDEFNELSSWNIWYGGAFNNEIQLYREEQIRLDEGKLKIFAQRKEITGPAKPFDATPTNFKYVSGRIESKQTYGPSKKEGESEYRFMARIKLPFGHGMWPAFWTYGDPWPTEGEIDILEARGSETDRFSSNIFYGPENGISINHDTEVKHSIGQNLTEDFHVYEMIWRANSIDILLDDKLLHSYQANSNNNIDKLFGKKQKIVFNTAVGGWFFQDKNSSNFADSSIMEVDWLRVYKR